MDWGLHGFTFLTFYSFPNLTYLTCSNRPLILFFHPVTLPGYPLFCCLFSEIWKDKKEWGPIIELFIACLAWPNLTSISRPISLFFHHLTPPVGGSLQIFERTVFKRTTYPKLGHTQNYLNKKLVCLDE